MSLSRAKSGTIDLNAAASAARSKTSLRRVKTFFLRYAVRLASLALFVGLWQFASASHLRLGFVTFANVPAPTEAFDAFVALARSGKLVPHLASSVSRVFAGFANAAVTGIVLGLAIARAKLAEDVFLPLPRDRAPDPGGRVDPSSHSDVPFGRSVDDSSPSPVLCFQFYSARSKASKT